MPYGRSASARPATSPSLPVSSRASSSCTFTLFTASALIPLAASSRPYARTRSRSPRAVPSRQNSEPPA
ncbi:hypothetical protein SGLAM104S_07015 [Streptomyces glaucescens]